jgi:hypothetical protein
MMAIGAAIGPFGRACEKLETESTDRGVSCFSRTIKISDKHSKSLAREFEMRERSPWRWKWERKTRQNEDYRCRGS